MLVKGRHKQQTFTLVIMLAATYIRFLSWSIYIPRITVNREDGFYEYVMKKGISINKLSDSQYLISYLTWNCIIDVSTAKRFKKKERSWKDMFETNVSVLSRETVLSPKTLHKMLGVLPEDGTPIILVARQGDFTIPNNTVIIRLNQHDALDARATMTMVWNDFVRSITTSASRQPDKQIIKWMQRGRNYGIWNISKPLVIPRPSWGLPNLRYYRGPLFFMKSDYFSGNMSTCEILDGIGMFALYAIADLKGDISTLGYTTVLDEYNTEYLDRFRVLTHKLVWMYYLVKDFTEI